MKVYLFLLIFFPGICIASCYDMAAKRYGVDPLMIQAMAHVESNENPGAIGLPLPDGNVALGSMQINTVHLPDIAKYNISREDLLDECTNIHLGAWQFSLHIKKFGKKWKAVGAYNTGAASTNIEAQERYIKKVASAYEILKNGGSLKNKRKIKRGTADHTAMPSAKELSSKLKIWNDDDE